MLRKVAAGLVLIPIAVLIVLFAVANRERVTVSFDPLSAGDPTFATPPVPLCLVILTPLIVGVILGGVATFMGQRKWRRTALRREWELRRMRTEMEALRLRLEPRPGPAPIAYRQPPAA
jgi:uncharacterized integral membrane protein